MFVFVQRLCPSQVALWNFSRVRNQLFISFVSDLLHEKVNIFAILSSKVARSDWADVLLADISKPHIADISTAGVSLIDQFERWPAMCNHATSCSVGFHFIS